MSCDKKHHIPQDQILISWDIHPYCSAAFQECLFANQNSKLIKIDVYFQGKKASLSYNVLYEFECICLYDQLLFTFAKLRYWILYSEQYQK